MPRFIGETKTQLVQCFPLVFFPAGIRLLNVYCKYRLGGLPRLISLGMNICLFHKHK